MSEPSVRILKAAEVGYERLTTNQTGRLPAGITKPAVAQKQLGKMKRVAIIVLVTTPLIVLAWVIAWAIWPRPSVAVIFDGVYTNASGQTRPWLVITNPLSCQIKYQMLPREVMSEARWSKSEGPKIISATGTPYETGLIFGGETLEPRSGFRFIVGDSTDYRPYRYPVLWALPPDIAAARPRWKKKLDEVSMRWRGRPTFLAYGIVRSPAIISELPNPGGAANRSQPVRSEINSTSSAAGSDR
jgi:hypothetical protein